MSAHIPEYDRDFVPRTLSSPDRACRGMTLPANVKEGAVKALVIAAKGAEEALECYGHRWQATLKDLRAALAALDAAK